MRKLLVIAKREWCAMVVTKAFLFTLTMMPVLMLGGIVIMPIIGKLGGTKERRIVVVDGTRELFDTIDAAARQRNEMFSQADTAKANKDSDKPDNPFEAGEIWNFEAAETPSITDDQRLELSKRLRDGSLYALLEIPENFFAVPLPKAKFVSQDAALSGARQWLFGVLRNQLRTRKLTELGIDPGLAMQADLPVVIEPAAPYRKAEDGKIDSKESPHVLTTFFLPFGIMMLMFMVIFLAAQPMLESAMEEKSDRIAELLLGSVSSTELMAGKLLGNVAGSLVVFAVYACGGIIVAIQNDWSLQLSWTIVPWLLIFQLLGVLFFSSIFLAIGASVSELKEAQSLLLPVWLLLAAPLMVWFIAVRDPNGAVPVALSFFPPSAPLMMSLRLAVGQTMPAWQAPLAALLMMAATAVIVLLAARIYRASLLKTDSARTFLALFRRLHAAD